MSADSDSVHDLLEEFLAQRDRPAPLEFEAWVAGYSGREEELRRAWEDLQRATDELARSPEEGGESLAHRVGQTIGEFTLVRRLGIGGQATVWEAEQEQLSRRVALKLLRPERISERDLALFRREARAGARLQHEGIVTVLDFGREGEVSWLAQELVPGGRSLRDRIDEVRRQAVAPPDWYAEVARTVRKIAEAMQAAHEAGIVHRDLKPQNILVTPEGAPKVSDFGLARVEDTTALSQSGDLVGTFLYMSPEQVTAKRAGVDLRTDVFSLGVVLYELLTLTRPFEGDTAHQICSRILHSDPPEPRVLRSQVPRDLSVICCKALEKERDKRYASMSALAEDLDRFLTNQPILAQPPGTRERLVKWSRRHPVRAVSSLATAIGITVVSGLVWRIVEQRDDLAAQRTELASQNEALNRANLELEEKTREVEARSRDLTVEKERVVAERDRLFETLGFQKSLFEGLDPEGFGAQLRIAAFGDYRRDLEARGLTGEEVEESLAELDRALLPINFTNIGVAAFESTVLIPASERIEETFGADPEIRGTLQLFVAKVCSRLGIADTGTDLFRSAVSALELAFGDEHRNTLDATLSWAKHLGQILALEEAVAINEDALARAEEHLGRNDETTIRLLTQLGATELLHGRTESSRKHLSEAVARAREHLPADHTARRLTLFNMASHLATAGSPAEAIPVFEELIEIPGILEEDPELSLGALTNLGLTLYQYARPAEALPHLERALELTRRVNGDRHMHTVLAFHHVGMVLRALDRIEESEPYTRSAVDSSRQIAGLGDTVTLTLLNSMGLLLKKQGRYEEALEYYQASLEGRRAVRGERHLETATSLHNLGQLYRSMDELEKALDFMLQAFDIRQEQLGDAHPVVLKGVHHISSTLLSLGRPDEAREILEPAMEIVEATLETSDPLRGRIEGMMRDCYTVLDAVRPGEGFDARAAEIGAGREPASSD